MTGAHAPVFRVFADGAGGGNPCPVVLDADGMSDARMLAFARRHDLECAFVLPSSDPRAAVRLRYFVPRHEMDMCVHATIAALSALAEDGTIGPASSVCRHRWACCGRGSRRTVW